MGLVIDNTMRKAFTLIEILVVMVILGITAGLAMPQFSKMKENELKKEALANLKLMQSAQKLYNLENGSYYTTFAAAATVNTVLKLNLPTSLEPWTYTSQPTGLVPGGLAQRVVNGVAVPSGTCSFAGTDNEPTCNTF